jgi:hypothetical protein
MEGSGDGRGERLHQLTTTYFETDFKLWGNDISGELIYRFKPPAKQLDLVINSILLAFSQATWSEIDIGLHKYPFALKVRLD